MAKDPGERWESAAAMVDALDSAMGSPRAATAAAAPATEATRRLDAPPPPPPPPAASPRRDNGARRPGAALLAGLAGLLLIGVLGFVLLSGDGGGDGEQASEPTPTATAERTAEPTPTETAEPTATPTETATPDATETAEPSGETDLDRAADLQLQGFNARQAGDNEQALALSQQALEACGDAQELDPCGYALYEVGAALNALGRPDEAIPFLQQRLDTYGNNGQVKAELRRAERAAGGDGD